MPCAMRTAAEKKNGVKEKGKQNEGETEAKGKLFATYHWGHHRFSAEAFLSLGRHSSVCAACSRACPS